MIKNDLKNKLLENNPYQKASTFSKIFFLWLNPLFKKGNKKIIEDNDIYEIKKKDRIEKHAIIIEKEFYKKLKELNLKKKKKNLIINIILKYYKKHIILYCILGIIKALCNIFSAKLLGYFIEEFDKSNFNIKILILYILIFSIWKIIEIFLNSHLIFGLGKLGIKIKFILNYIIYKKILKIKQFNNKNYSFGDLININNVETYKFIQLFNYMPNIISAPIVLILGLYFMIDLMGWSVVISILSLILYIFLNIKLSNQFIKYEKDLINKRGNRIKFINEVISSLRFIKYSSLEELFYKKLIKIKELELISLKKEFKRQLISITLSWFIPLLFLTMLIVSDYLIKKTLSIKKILQAIILFSIVDEIIKTLPNVFLLTINSYLSGKKINKFLFQEDINFKNINFNKKEDENNNVIKINNLDFYWKKTKEQIKIKENNRKSLKRLSSSVSKKEVEFELNNVNLNIKKGSLVAIIGQIGSGKTSLINSMFGELDLKFDKKYNVLNSTAIVSQKPWIRNKTLKENILNGKIYEEQLYKKCINYSCLEEDLKQLENRDETLIGDRGINLSGGQKVRISIARALYSEKEIIIMDDPLSSLDNDVSNYVFNKSILEFLKNKTRIIITHNIHILNSFDRILLMSNGEIVEDGNYEEIKNKENYKNLINIIKENDNSKKEKTEEKENIDLNLKKEDSKKLDLIWKKEDSKKLDLIWKKEENRENIDPMINRLMNTENKNQGKISLKVIYNYIKFSESKKSFLFEVIILILLGIAYIYSYFFLNYYNRFTKLNFLLIYSFINLIQIFLIYFRVKILFYLSINVSRKLNKIMTFKLLHSSLLNFLDKIPIGTILNRFSDDVQQTDRYWILVFSFVLFLIKRVIVCIIICCIFATPLILIFFIIFLFIANYYRKYYMKTYREIARLMKISNSPLNQVINETILGSFIIRIYKLENNLIKEFNDCINNNLKYRLIQIGMKSWYILRITILNLLILIPSMIFVILFKNDKNKELIGIMFSFLLTFINISTLLMNMLSIFDVALISFERCLYLTQIKPEKRYKIDSKKFITNINKKKKFIFEKGIITIENLKIRYSKNLPYVIKDISCELKNKIGIIGRTGAGKSTLIQSFYGLFEEYEGNIKIDGTDIKKIDLQSLRNSFSIISQEPILFEDTIRNNLDPLNINSDEKIKDIIIELGLSEKIIDLGGLDGKIESQGKNLSNGEKQLFCLIRIILNKKKIILLDEATSNIDNKTEELIQKIMGKYFINCTQIIIAHRLNTILNCDKILVLEKGKILEFDSPKILLENKESYFSNILNKNNNNSLKEYLK